MARWDRLRRILGRNQAQVEATEPDASKAIAPAAETYTPNQVGTLVAATARAAAQVNGSYNPLPRLDPQVPFGPGVPLIPAAIDPLRRDGRTEPRFNEYPVTSNLPGVGDRLVPWKVLRDAADAGGLARRCIEIRKSEVTTLDWAVTITKEAVEAAQAASDRPRSEVEQGLRQSLSAEIVRCTRFWQKPDPGQDETFGEWISKLLEEHFVLDALAIYPRRTFGGDLYALEILDGSTIKPLRDHRGGRPLPPNPAFQQLLWGFPRGEFIADADGDGNVIGGYGADQLVYKRRNVRAHTPYGYSAVEQALEDIDVWLRRRKWIRDEYSEGTLPAGYLKNTGATSWTPSQLREYETEINDAYSGSTAARHRLRVLPPGFEIDTPEDFGEKYKPDYDLFLIKQIASHFDVTIAELGYTEQGGLGSTGWHEGQADVQDRKGTQPTLFWLQQMLTSISRAHLRMPEELEFRFLGLEDDDEDAADAVADRQVRGGRMTVNEDRDRMGRPRYDFPEADMPMVITATGVIPLNGSSTRAAQEADAEDPAGGKPASGDPKEAEATAGTDGGGEERADAVKAELAAYRRWVRRNSEPSRPFRFTTVTKADAPDLALNTWVMFAPDDAEVDAVPKVRAVAWPGWDRDQDTATVWAARLASQLRKSVDCDQVAERWLARELVKAEQPSEEEPEQTDGAATEAAVAAAVAFLVAQGVTPAVPLSAVLAGLWAEGWALGAASAQASRTGHPVWFGWLIGDDTAARQALTATMAQALDAFLDDSRRNIPLMADRRLRVFARILVDAKVRGLTARQLAQALRDALRDDAWVRMVALTELTRAVAAAARAEYEAAGVTHWRWVTEPSACPICVANEAAGVIEIGHSWPDGSDAPPAHPHCRCYPAPA